MREWTDRDKELIRCYQCKHFKPVGRGHSGWRQATASTRIFGLDFCDPAEKKGGTRIFLHGLLLLKALNSRFLRRRLFKILDNI
jgi:hypothetical protein